MSLHSQIDDVVLTTPFIFPLSSVRVDACHDASFLRPTSSEMLHHDQPECLSPDTEPTAPSKAPCACHVALVGFLVASDRAEDENSLCHGKLDVALFEKMDSTWQSHVFQTRSKQEIFQNWNEIATVCNFRRSKGSPARIHTLSLSGAFEFPPPPTARKCNCCACLLRVVGRALVTEASRAALFGLHATWRCSRLSINPCPHSSKFRLPPPFLIHNSRHTMRDGASDGCFWVSGGSSQLTN